MNEVSKIPTWLPESQRDTSYYIFVSKWRCEVSNRQTQSLNYVRFHGVPHTGNAQIDKQMRDEMVIRMLSINEMVEFHKTGVAIHVKSREDTKKIYDYITAHLKHFEAQMDSIHNRGLPMDDLIALDNLAQAVYPFAVPYFPKGFVGSAMQHHIGDRVTHAQMFAPIVKPKVTGDGNVVMPKIPERVGFGELLKEHGRKTGKVSFSKWD